MDDDIEGADIFGRKPLQRVNCSVDYQYRDDQHWAGQDNSPKQIVGGILDYAIPPQTRKCVFNSMPSRDGPSCLKPR